MHIFVRDRQTGTTERISEALDGTRANGSSHSPCISGDGRYVVFKSYASNLVSAEDTTESDIFVHDRQTGTTERVSVASDGTQANYSCDKPCISSDGRYVAFVTYASNLVGNDTNGELDIFVHDRQTGNTERANISSDDEEADDCSDNPTLSADGRYVAFSSSATNLAQGDTNGTWDCFVHDRQTGNTERVSVAFDASQANDNSRSTWISADGQYVTFVSTATNLVPDDINAADDIFVYDRQMQVTERVNVAANGPQSDNENLNPSISDDGRYVAYESFATNLVPGDTNGKKDVFLFDCHTWTTERASVTWDGNEANGSSEEASISIDGRYVAFSSVASNLVVGDTNSRYDIFVLDRDAGTMERVSVASDGSQANDRSNHPSVSSDGRYVAFASEATNVVAGDTNGKWDVFVHDRQTGATERVSVASDSTEANDWNDAPSISDDGRYVAFKSNASNLVVGDTNGLTDIFVHDRLTHTTERASVATDGSEADGDSRYPPFVSGDGRYVVFPSFASNLVVGDTNLAADIFLRDRKTGVTERVSVASDGTQGDSSSYEPSISRDGRYVAFSSNASNLVPGDTNTHQDVFVHDRQTGFTERMSVAIDGAQSNHGSLHSSISGRWSVLDFYCRLGIGVPGFQ